MTLPRRVMTLARRLPLCLSLFTLLVCAPVLHAPLHAQVTGQQRAEAAGHSLVGSPAPRKVLKTIDGQTIDLGSLYGKKAVYLKFWATWCVPCREQMPHFERTYESAGSDLQVIAVNAGFNDSIDDVRAYRKQLGIKMPIVIDDGTLGTAFNLRVTPQHVVIGRDGRIQYVGHLASEQLDAAIQVARSSPATGVAGGSNGGGGRGVDSGRPGDGKVSRYGVGDRAPPFSAKTLDGSLLDFQQPAKQQPAVLVFMTPWCESYLETSRAQVSKRCRDVRVGVEELAKQRPQVRWLGIASGIWASREDLSKYKTQFDVTIPLTLDESGALFQTFQVRSVPTVIVINSQGKIERRIEGGDPRLVAQLQEVALTR